MSDIHPKDRASFSTSDLPPSSEELHSLLSMAALAALLAGALDIGSMAIELLLGEQQSFGWADGLALGAALPGLVVLFAFWTLGERVSSKGLQVSVAGMYLCGWSATVAGFASYDSLPIWAQMLLGTLAVILLIGVVAALATVYPVVGQGMTAVKGLVVISMIVFLRSGGGKDPSIVPVFINVYWFILIAIGVIAWIWFSVSLIRVRSDLGFWSALLGWAQLAALFILIGASIWALTGLAMHEDPELITEESLRGFTQQILRTVIALEAPLTLLTALLLLSASKSPVVRGGNDKSD